MLALQTLTYIERYGRTDRTIWNYATGTLTPCKEPDTMAKPDHRIHLNCTEVCNHASCKTTRTRGSFNHQGKKMFLLSDEL